MKKRSVFFVRDGKLYTRKDGKMVEVWKWLRRFKGAEVTPIFPHILNKHVVLVASNRPIAVFHIYANGDMKEEPVKDDKEYVYELALRK